MIEPFPRTWPINLDFIASLKLQSIINKKQELFCYGGVVSSGGKVRREPEHTELGIEISSYDSRITGHHITWGHPEPTGEPHTITQKELWDDIEATGLPPDAVTKTRGLYHKIPRQFRSSPLMDGAEMLLSVELSSYVPRRRVRETLGIDVSSPGQIVFPDLISRKLIKGGDSTAKRIRSTLKTMYIQPYPMGWRQIADDVLNLQRVLRKDKWWMDTGLPHEVNMRFDGSIVNATIYTLDSRPDKLIAL